MAKVKGVKEKLHMPLYDAFFVPPTPVVPAGAAAPFPRPNTFETRMTDPRLLRFFVDVQDKTKLETNLQASGVLPSLNTYEARAMRVIFSGPPALVYRQSDGTAIATPALPVFGSTSADLLAQLIYNSVTTLLVGEKIMIEAPTLLFPAGAGVTPGTANVTNHGEADPMATFRFAEPVIIEPNQNFRVEMLFPRGVPGQGSNAADLATVAGSLRLWVVLDGYLTRDVQ
jgi:hypothetical protein